MGKKHCRFIAIMICFLLLCGWASFVHADSGYISLSSSIQGTYYEGSSLYIGWSSSAAGSYVSLELYKDGDYDSIITSYTSNTGWYYWQIPSGVSSSKPYQIKITSIANTSITDMSHEFHIYKKSITVTSPSGGETWYTKESYEITWSSEHVGTYVYIGYNRGGYTQTITSATSNDGSYSWTIPSSLTLGSSYRIYIRDYSDSDVYDYSEYFTVDERYIHVQSPQQGAMFYSGDRCQVTWESKNAGDLVTLTLYENNMFHSVLTSSTPNDGTYSWEIPPSIEGTIKDRYLIRVTSTDYGSVTATSGSFSIVQRSITITTPHGGETWYKGEHHTILWDSEFIGSFVDIELYENGAFVASLSLSETNDGEYTWSIPSSLNSSSQYAIKVSSTTYEDVYGFSTGYVTVRDTVLQQSFPILAIIIAASSGIIVCFFLYRYIKKRLPKEPKKKSANQPEPVTNTEAKTMVTDQDFDNIWEQ